MPKMTSWYVEVGGGLTSSVSLSWQHKGGTQKLAEGQADVGEEGYTQLNTLVPGRGL